MTLTQDYDYTATTRQAESIISDALETWKNGLNAVTAPLQTFPTSTRFPEFDAAEAVERQFTFIKKVVDVNYGYARELAEATNTVTGAVRQHIEGLSAAILEQVQSVSEATQGTVQELENSLQETADEAERLQREAVEQAEQAQQAERRRVRKAARERYRSLTKGELADEAAKRNLRKTGTVDELVDRLVEDDTNE
jgi:tRNA uridine 5-carbamoylmethylation protein Kti12